MFVGSNVTHHCSIHLHQPSPPQTFSGGSLTEFLPPIFLQVADCLTSQAGGLCPGPPKAAQLTQQFIITGDLCTTDCVENAEHGKTLRVTPQNGSQTPQLFLPHFQAPWNMAKKSVIKKSKQPATAENPHHSQELTCICSPPEVAQDNSEHFLPLPSMVNTRCFASAMEAKLKNQPAADRFLSENPLR